MFGIDDPQVWMAYLLCLAAAAFSVIYGVLNWNKGDNAVRPEDKQWVKGEKAVEEQL
jgi:hypothetical protein